MARSKKTTKKSTTKSPVRRIVSKKSSRLNDGYYSNDLSFKIVKDSIPFMSIKITQQTIIWSILLIFIMIVQIWILSLQLDVANSIEALK